MRAHVLWGVVAVAMVGCGFDAVADAGDTDTDSGDEDSASLDTTPATSQTGPSTTTPGTGPMTGGETTAGTATVTGDATGDTDTAEPATDTTEPVEPGCPDPLPDGWIFCEDFEDIGKEDFNDRFSIFASNEVGDREETFRIDTIEAFSGEASLTVWHQPGMTWVGEAGFRFGAGPGTALYAPDENFDEVWVRVQVFLEEGWSMGGHAELLQVNSVESGFEHTMSASVDGPIGDDVLRARARTCISSGGEILCSGFMDGATLSDNEIGTAEGSTSFFTPAHAGEWHCIVARVRLGSPGEADGRVRFWLDDGDEADLQDIDFRGQFDGNGLNLIRLNGFWGGATEPVYRFMDDLVVSRTELACSQA